MTRQFSECPKCHSPLGAKATYCGCGWKAEVKQAEKAGGLPPIPGKSEGFTRCAWRAHGEQCHYAGTTSHNTVGMGPWYCRFHAAPDISMAYGAQVVEQSRSGVMPAQPNIKGCEEIHCVGVGHLQPNGRYLCYQHKKTPDEIEYAKPKKNNIQAPPTLREPGMDEETDPLDVASQG